MKLWMLHIPLYIELKDRDYDGQNRVGPVLLYLFPKYDKLFLKSLLVACTHFGLQLSAGNKIQSSLKLNSFMKSNKLRRS